jgi:hypothetical protein
MKRAMAILILIASPALADDTKKLAMTEGQWEIAAEVTMESRGGLSQSGPAQPVKLCLTRKSPVPVDPKGAPGMTCTKKHTITASDVSWTATCKGTSSASEGTGTVTYADKTFTGSSESTVKIKGGADIKITMKMTGKYLGACPR